MSMSDNFSKSAKFTRVSNAVAAGSTNSNCTGIDMAGYESVTFVAALGALTATQVTKLKAQQSSDNGAVDTWDDIAGSATAPAADADSNKCLVLEVAKPRKRYVRAVVLRGTANAVIDGVLAIQTGARTNPPTQPTGSVSQSNLVAGAAEGTA